MILTYVASNYQLKNYRVLQNKSQITCHYLSKYVIIILNREILWKKIF